jgi:hypothetical protein
MMHENHKRFTAQMRELFSETQIRPVWPQEIHAATLRRKLSDPLGS